SGIAPRSPTLACAKDARAPFFEAFAGGRFCGSGVADGTDVAGIATAACWPDWIAGRGRGKGTFCASAVAAWADSADAAVNVKQMLKRLRLVAFIQPRLIRRPGDPDSGKVANALAS
ncbi:MAG: hypothetical protein WCD26_25100, partial [Pseudolabrys sp.]